MMKIMVKDELILKLKNLNNISQIIKKYEKIDKDILKKINQNKNENIVYYSLEKMEKDYKENKSFIKLDKNLIKENSGIYNLGSRIIVWRKTLENGNNNIMGIVVEKNSIYINTILKLKYIFILEILLIFAFILMFFILKNKAEKLEKEMEENKKLLNLIKDYQECKNSLEGSLIELEKRVSKKSDEIMFQKNYLAMIIDNIPVGIIIKDVKNNFKIITWNKKIEEIKGIKSEDAIGKNDYELYEKNGEIERKKEERVIRSKSVMEEIMEYKLKSGEKKWVRNIVIPIYNEKEESEFIFTIVEDITLMEKNKKEKIKMENKFQFINKNISDTTWSIKLNGEIEYISGEIEKLTGYTSEEIKDKGLNLIFTKESYAQMKKNLIEIQKEKIGNFEYKLSCKDGKEKWILLKFMAERNDEDKVVSIYGVARDINDRKLYELELIKAKENAEKANKSKSEFLANMSHEIRTPMNGIIGFSDILLEEEKDEEKKEIIGFIKDSGRNLLEIINNILDISKIEAGKMRVDEVEFDIWDTTKRVAALLENMIKNKGVELFVEIDDKIPKNICGDFIKFEQIITNLLSNAAKFTEKGYILIKMELREKVENKLFIELRVKDTGIGIKKEQKQIIFENFKQGDDYLTKRYKGTGLGLTIVKNLTNLLGWGLEVESEYDKGSCFIIEMYFKSKIDGFEEDNIKEEKLKISSIKKKILIVEDNEANKIFIKKLMESKKYIVDIVENGEKAVEKVVAKDFDLILMDIQLPTINGIEAAKMIKKMKKIPIIAVTAYAMEEDKRRILESGIDDYITKPINKGELYVMIEKYLDRE